MGAKDFLPAPVAVKDPVFPELEIPGALSEKDVSNLNSKGWLPANKTMRDTGKPQTFEEQQFVLDYLASYGMLPTTDKYSGLQQAGTYDPESTMGGLGFLNYDQYVNAQREGETYGPLAGTDVPYNTGIVTTDEFGNPVMRYMDVNKPSAQRAISEGRYINPLVGEGAAKYKGGLPGSEKYYNRPMGEKPQLNEKDLISAYGTPQFYLEGLSGYLDSQVGLDYPKVDAAYNQMDALNKEYNDYAFALNQEIEKGNLKSSEAEKLIAEKAREAQLAIDELRNQLEYAFMTEERSKREYAKAATAIDQGTPLDQLPFFNEVSPTIWARGTEEQQRQYEAQKSRQPAQWTGYPQGEVQTKQDFLRYANGLDLSPEYRRWLLGQYGNLKTLWQQSGEPEFLTWLNSYLAGGG